MASLVVDHFFASLSLLVILTTLDLKHATLKYEGGVGVIFSIEDASGGR